MKGDEQEGEGPKVIVVSLAALLEVDRGVALLVDWRPGLADVLATGDAFALSTAAPMEKPRRGLPAAGAAD